MIALLTIPNTGTWFITELLKLHPDIRHIIEYNAGFFGIGRMEITRSLFSYDPEMDYSKALYRRHIFGNSTHGEIDLICMGHKTIIPMRDPLASLISRKHRNPLEPMYEHIDAFVYAATSPHINNSFIMPIDTDNFKSSDRNRFFVALDMFKFVGLDIPTGLNQWARDNAPKNAMGAYEQKKAYDNGDLSTATTQCRGELEYLKSKENILRPWLNRLGYGQLMWYGV